jgi:hypothetical protein
MTMGKRSAVGSKTGKPVANSGPVLRRPTPSPTPGRNPGACPPISAQSWPGRGAGSPAKGAVREAEALSPTDDEVAELIAFFKLLDLWVREGANAEAM